MGAGHNAEFNTRSHGIEVGGARFHAQLCQSSCVTVTSLSLFLPLQNGLSHTCAFSASWDRTK